MESLVEKCRSQNRRQYLGSFSDSVEPPKLFAPPSLPPPITPPVERFSEQVHEKSVNSNADQKRSSDSKKTMKEDGTTEEQDVEEEKQKKKKRHKTIIIKSSLFFSTLLAILPCLFVGLIDGADRRVSRSFDWIDENPDLGHRYS